jgi:menaquinone-dependent protoporphyrinogen oxidase
MSVDWTHVCGVLIGASLHGQRHQAAAAAFIEDHVEQLNRLPSAFFSVSLSAASAKREEREAAIRIATEFPRACHWYPDAAVPLAGRLAYTSYGTLKRMLMKWIARREGAPTDTSRDYEFTDWSDVRALADEMARVIRARDARQGVA